MSNEPSRAVSIIALAGSPNVGKSSIFNALTGLSQHVGNWPGKTVEQKSGTCTIAGRTLQVVDLPGTYSLTANSLEEQLARDFIIRKHPDAVVVVVNAANLERTLYLLAETSELPAPVVVALNMMDVAEHQGLRIEPEVLQAALGIPVVALVATRAAGSQELLEVVEGVICGRIPAQPRPPDLDPELEILLAQVDALLGEFAPADYPRRWLALKLLEGDTEISSLVRAQVPAEQWQTLDALLHRHEDAVLAIADARYEWIGRMTRAAIRKPPAGAISLTDRFDHIATHPILGPVLLLSMLGLVIWLVYLISQPLVELINLALLAGAEGLRTLLSGAPSWLVHLLADGLIGGVGTVVSLLPILALFFVAIAFLEDVGYLARGAFVADRAMHLLGLHGKSFLPLFLGLGCNVPAILGTRILDSKRDRLLTLLLVPLVPCAGRMAVLVFFSGALFGGAGPLVVLGLLALDIAVIALTGLALRRVLFRGASPAFIMELPLYHLPNWKSIGLNTWHNIVGFLKRAGTVILLLSLVIWLLAELPTGDISQSYLAWFGRGLAPIGSLMGLDWRMMVALLSSIVAKEQTIATLAILTAGSGLTLAAELPLILSPTAGLAFLVVQMLFVPCIGTLTAIRQETGNWRATLFSVGYLAVVSFVVGTVVYQAARLLGMGV
ncbi:MAG: ferrous iron transport protein B [Anaerolineae bacterium]